MPLRILDVDLDGLLPDGVRLDGRDGLWLVVWRGDIPVGSALLRPEGGGPSISGESISRGIAPFRVLAGERVEPGPAVIPVRVSVVICTRDRADRLPFVLESLGAQTFQDFELVIVDNAPVDARTRRVVESWAPHACYVVEPVPGLPRARNAGVRVASGDVVAFTDDDCRPSRRWVETIARSFAADPRLGCVTGPILPLELETPAQEAMEMRGGFNRGFRRVRYAPETADGPVYPVQAWKFGAGVSMALSRACLEALGGFDEALCRSEDLDIFYRTLRAGYALCFEPGAVVRHRHLPSWDQLARRLFHWGWGYTTYLDKIARTDASEYVARARLEQRNWLAYHLRGRLRPALRGGADLPVGLIALELAGGIAGLRGYPLARAAASRRAQRGR